MTLQIFLWPYVHSDLVSGHLAKIIAYLIFAGFSGITKKKKSRYRQKIYFFKKKKITEAIVLTMRLCYSLLDSIWSPCWNNRLSYFLIFSKFFTQSWIYTKGPLRRFQIKRVNQNIGVYCGIIFLISIELKLGRIQFSVASAYPLTCYYY